MQIQNSVVLVTGASSGLGLATAKEIIALGGKAVLADVNETAGRAQARTLGSNACFIGTDITQDSDCERAVATALEAFGGLHGLVNCAGVAPAEKVLGRQGSHSMDNFRRTVAINLCGSFNMIRAAAHAMAQGEANAQGERGVIVTTASIAAYEGQLGQAAYAASKGGVAAMTLPIARELAHSGIRVMCIAPGIFQTPLMATMPQAVQDGLAAGVPFPPRLGQPREYAALVSHIFGNSMLNGEIIRLDGALRMAAR